MKENEIEKIELTEEEIEVIKACITEELDPYYANERQQELLTGIIDRADAILDKLWESDPDYDFGSDTVKWYYNLYRKQQGLPLI